MSALALRRLHPLLVAAIIAQFLMLAVHAGFVSQSISQMYPSPGRVLLDIRRAPAAADSASALLRRAASQRMSLGRISYRNFTPIMEVGTQNNQSTSRRSIAQLNPGWHVELLRPTAPATGRWVLFGNVKDGTSFYRDLYSKGYDLELTVLDISYVLGSTIESGPLLVVECLTFVLVILTAAVSGIRNTRVRVVERMYGRSHLAAILKEERSSVYIIFAAALTNLGALFAFRILFLTRSTTVAPVDLTILAFVAVAFGLAVTASVIGLMIAALGTSNLHVAIKGRRPLLVVQVAGTGIFAVTLVMALTAVDLTQDRISNLRGTMEIQSVWSKVQGAHTFSLANVSEEVIAKSAPSFQRFLDTYRTRTVLSYRESPCTIVRSASSCMVVNDLYLRLAGLATTTGSSSSPLRIITTGPRRYDRQLVDQVASWSAFQLQSRCAQLACKRLGRQPAGMPVSHIRSLGNIPVFSDSYGGSTALGSADLLIIAPDSGLSPDFMVSALSQGQVAIFASSSVLTSSVRRGGIDGLIASVNQPQEQAAIVRAEAFIGLLRVFLVLGVALLSSVIVVAVTAGVYSERRKQALFSLYTFGASFTAKYSKLLASLALTATIVLIATAGSTATGLHTFLVRSLVAILLILVSVPVAGYYERRFSASFMKRS